MAITKRSTATTETGSSNGGSKTVITIKPPRYETASFDIVGQPDVPLVIHRFSSKTKAEMLRKMEVGKSAGSKKTRDPKDTDKTFEQARYRHKEGWDGFHAAALRNAMVSACQLVGFRTGLAKMSVFVLQDGMDKEEPQIPLIRILDTEPQKQLDMARVATGDPYVTVRAAYHNWKAKINIRWDADQFSLDDITNLLVRVGSQVGIGEGRPNSKKSCGMGWGLFDLVQAPPAEAV